ncbi:MAG TPA: type II toxin-antitoxin system HicB family antitoxin [Hyphomicrobiaceae bacterium]|nr:type II toxin-antitoxin system HicB family antitoxin [Hyphomicrobiaceae bacterium]
MRVPAFPEIMTFADDETEALALAKEAIELAIEDRTARGEPIPAQDAMWLHSVALAA